MRYILCGKRSLERNTRTARLRPGGEREGRGLLQGLLRCGRCGRMMRTGYDRSGTSGVRPRNYCAAESTYLGRKSSCCQSADGRELGKEVLAQVFAALELAALAATAQALAGAEATRGRAAEGLRARRRACPLRGRAGLPPCRTCPRTSQRMSPDGR